MVISFGVANYASLAPFLSYAYEQGRFGFNISADATLGKGYLASDSYTENKLVGLNCTDRLIDPMKNHIYLLNANVYYDFDRRALKPDYSYHLSLTYTLADKYNFTLTHVQSDNGLSMYGLPTNLLDKTETLCLPTVCLLQRKSGRKCIFFWLTI